MMNGINILNQTEIMEYSNTQRVIGIIAIILLAISICAFAIFVAENHDRLTVFSGAIFIISVITLAIIASIGESHPTGRYKYEVTIDDTVPMTEVYKKYTVVKQKGCIWILKDKEVEE